MKLLLILPFLFTGVVASAAQEAPQAPQDDLRAKLAEVYVKAADLLVSKQSPVGAWRTGPPGREQPSPAYTGLIITSLGNAPDDLKSRYEKPIKLGIQYLLSAANSDGSFGEGRSGAFMKTYATALSMMALSSVERDRRVSDALRGAQAWLRRNQLKEGLHEGGLGYGDQEPKRDPETGKFVVKRSAHANLSATSFAADAMSVSGLSTADPWWHRTRYFVGKCQNNSETNNDPALLAEYRKEKLSVGDDGGFVYAPVADRKIHKAGSVKVGDRETLASYGAMTYDGIKTYLYCGLAKDSPEVEAAIGWVRRNYSVTSHPGFPFDRRKRSHERGLFHYYLILSRALDAYGENPFVTADGREHDWARELAGRVVETVRTYGLWKNDNPAWYEGDEVLVTGYVLNVCDVLFENLE